MKTRNPVIFSPHRGARKCIKETARILAEAAVRAGAPEDAIQCDHALAERVRRAADAAPASWRSSSPPARRPSCAPRRSPARPTLGVGPGNVPVYVHGSADVPLAARSIVFSKTFDNSTVCGSEQAIVVEPHVERQLRPLLEKAGAFFCTPAQMRALGRGVRGRRAAPHARRGRRAGRGDGGRARGIQGAGGDDGAGRRARRHRRRTPAVVRDPRARPRLLPRGELRAGDRHLRGA